MRVCYNFWQGVFMQLKTKVVLIISSLLLSVSIIGSVINYHKNVQDTQTQLQTTALPLSVDNIYTEVQQRMIEPLLVSSLMANDTFLRDWILEGENDVDSVMRYLTHIQQKYDIFTTFLVSDKTKTYYHPRGIIDIINAQNSADKWYFNFISQSEPYEINLDHNANLGDFLVMFINHKVMDYNNQVLGVTGVGVRLVNIEEMLRSFKTKYKYDVYFIAQDGEITLYSKGLNKRGNIHTIEGLKEIKEFVILNELEKNTDYKSLYLDANKIDIYDFKYENEIITNLRGVIAKSSLYLENGKMIKIYTNNKNILPKNREKIEIISGHLVTYRGNIQIILYSTSDFKIGN